jgi:hypothetical protein
MIENITSFVTPLENLYNRLEENQQQEEFQVELAYISNSPHLYYGGITSSLSLTKVEKQYLDGTRQFTKAQQRYIRSRLRKKLRL